MDREVDNFREDDQPNLKPLSKHKFFVFFITNKAVFIILGVICLLSALFVSVKILSQKDEVSNEEVSSTVSTPTVTAEPTGNSDRQLGTPDDIENHPGAAAPRTNNNPPNPTLTSTPTETPTPTPSSDTTSPYLASISGPEDGSTITYNDFCFVVSFNDNVTSSSDMYVQYRFPSDTSDWSSWSNDSSSKNICYSDIANGSYSFSVRGKDAAGNYSLIYKTSFTVAVP